MRTGLRAESPACDDLGPLQLRLRFSGAARTHSRRLAPRRRGGPRGGREAATRGRAKGRGRDRTRERARGRPAQREEGPGSSGLEGDPAWTSGSSSSYVTPRDARARRAGGVVGGPNRPRAYDAGVARGDRQGATGVAGVPPADRVGLRDVVPRLPRLLSSSPSQSGGCSPPSQLPFRRQTSRVFGGIRGSPRSVLPPSTSGYGCCGGHA